MSLHDLTHTHLEFAKPSVGSIHGCRLRLPLMRWTLWFAPEDGEYAGQMVLLRDGAEVQAVLTAGSGDSAINALAALRGDFDVVVADEPE